MDRDGLVAVGDLAKESGRPSRAYLFALIAKQRIRRYKFPGDRKTYVRREDLERAVKTPKVKK